MLGTRPRESREPPTRAPAKCPECGVFMSRSRTLCIKCAAKEFSARRENQSRINSENSRSGWARRRKPDLSWKGVTTMHLPFEALQAWGWSRDPFADGPYEFPEMFLSNSHEQIRNLLVSTIQRTGSIAISAEIGWGKSVLWDAIEHDLTQDTRMGYLVTRPVAIDRGRIGPNLLQIALLSDLDKRPRTTRNSELLTRDLVEVLKARTAISKRIVLIVDEAHRLNDVCFRAFKLLLDIRAAGLRRALSIILLGQPELGTIMRRPAIAEVGARIEVVEPDALSIQDGEVRRYIGHRLCLARTDRAPIEEAEYDSAPFDESALVAIEAELSGYDSAPESGITGTVPTYLAINAICSHTLNEAWAMSGGETPENITEDMVRMARSTMLAGL